MPGRFQHRVPGAAVVVAVAVLVAAAFGPWYLNYDARYALLWAGDLAGGRTPDFLADFAPTPHPLSILWSLPSAVLGAEADVLITALTLLAFGLAVWLTYRLGSELFGHWAVGAVAALVVVSRPVLLRDAVLGYQDVPFACFVLGAVLVEARRPRNGYRTLALLCGAGLLRPEAWLLGGLYWLYLVRPRTDADGARRFPGLPWRHVVALAALVWLAPAVWVLMDWAVTGDPLHSLNGTSALAAAADRRRTFGEVPKWTAYYFGNVLREPGLLGVALGLGVAWWLRLRRAWLPLSLVVAMVVVFALNPAFGLPLIGRYVRTPSMLLALLYGLAVTGWLLVGREDPRRRVLQGVAAVAVLATVAYLPFQVRMLSALATRVDRTTPFYTGLRDLARTPATIATIRACGGGVSVADYRPIPYLRYWLRLGPDTVTTVAQGASPLGRALVLPRRSRATRYVYRDNYPRDVRAPAGWPTVARNASWRLVADPACARADPR